jgi:hypothetical protein
MRCFALVTVLVLTGFAAQAQNLTHQQILAKAWEIANQRSGYVDEDGNRVIGPIAQGSVDQIVREIEAQNAASTPARAAKPQRRAP